MSQRRIPVLLLLWGMAAPLATAAQDRPNILLIMSDDMGYADLSSYGAPDISTPHIDGIGKEGVRLTDFYAAGSVCTPTRAALLTGRYPQRLGFERPLAVGSDYGLPVDGRSLPQVLKGVGYSTGLVGKWHLGYTAELSPRAHGFDYFFGIKSGFGHYWEHRNGAGEDDLWEDQEPVRLEGHITDLIAQRAVAWIERNAGGPFFLDVSFTAPHAGGGLTSRAEYVATMEHMDAAVGELLAAIDRLGLTDRTMVIFTNDNGGEFLSFGGPLFHRKWTVWEGGIRVPLMVRWPQHIPAGTVSHQVGITMDLTASILTAAGTTPREDLEGIDLVPMLSGVSAERARTLFWRSPDGNQLAVRSGDWKAVSQTGIGRPLLFDLRNDVSERRDHFYQQTDVAENLLSELRSWVQDVDREAGLRTARP